MIRVHVRVDDVGDAHPLRGGEGRVRVGVFLVGVDDRALSQRATAKEVGRAACIEIVVRAKDHGVVISYKPAVPGASTRRGRRSRLSARLRARIPCIETPASKPPTTNKPLSRPCPTI